MNLVPPFDSLVIDLTLKEQEDIKILIQLQEDAGGVDAKLDFKFEN